MSKEDELVVMSEAEKVIEMERKRGRNDMLKELNKLPFMKEKEERIEERLRKYMESKVDISKCHSTK